MEEWRPVIYKGVKTNYEVSSYGNVRTKRRVKLLAPRFTGKGYLSIGICIKGERYQYKIHQMVAHAFLIRPSPKHNPHHIDENKTNNRLDNLEYITHIDNIQRYHKNKELAHGINL